MLYVTHVTAIHGFRSIRVFIHNDQMIPAGTSSGDLQAGPCKVGRERAATVRLSRQLHGKHSIPQLLSLF